MADLKEFAEKLVNLSVKEVNELADILKEEYGIEPAAAAVAVAGPVAGGGAGEAGEEKSDFDVILKAAGGAITNLDNENLYYGSSNYEHGGIIVASNNLLMHESICLKIKNIMRENDIYPNQI